ncbi:MAG: restriction endonuclease subunit S [Butyrivibrio sp.]|nr:restriction endonuclease subunit S [Butyrivibrio sp.]
MNKQTTENELRDSRQEWLREIPAGWKLSKIGSLYSLRNTKVSDKDFAPLSVTMKGIVPQLETAAKSDDGDNRKLVRKGDFAINSRSDRRGSCGISEYDGSVSLINTVLTPKEEMDPGYYNWLFHTVSFADEFYKWGHGIVDDLWTTRWQEMKRIVVPIPPLSVQHEIALSLDEKCSQIDATIKEVEEGIEEYKKWKMSIIYEATTKGLEKNVAYRDSGIWWIGQIPEKWRLIRVKHAVKIENGSDPQTEGDIPVYGSGTGSFKTCGEYKEGPTVLLGRKGATLHIPHYIEGRYWNVDTAFNTKIINPIIQLKYFYYLAICFDYPAYRSQTTLPSMTQTNYNSMHIPCPDMPEQASIVTFLDEKIEELDSHIKEKEDLIADLESYKQSLIYETVTGKRKVV